MSPNYCKTWLNPWYMLIFLRATCRAVSIRMDCVLVLLKKCLFFARFFIKLSPFEEIKTLMSGPGLDHCYTIAGPCLGHVWDMSEPCLGHAWALSGPCLGHVWDLSHSAVAWGQFLWQFFKVGLFILFLAFSTYFLYVIERSVRENKVDINFKTKNCIWKMTDLGEMQKKQPFLGTF